MAGNIVQVIFEAKDAMGGVLRGITGQLGDMGRVIESLTEKDIRWGNVAQYATSAVVGELKKAVEETLKYAGEVRQLSSISGESTEATSRFIQVLDDYGLTTDDALTATKALTKEGHAPTIETLAELSDKYLSLNTVEEKNEFILKNLGKGGLEWVNVLNKGSKALLDQGAAVSKNLILTDKQVKAARQAEIAFDDWNDTLQGLKVTAGSELLPVLSDFAKMMNADLQAVTGLSGAIDEAVKGGGFKSLEDWLVNIVGSNFPQFLKDMGFGVKGFDDANSQAAQTAQDAANSIDSENQSLQDTKAAAKAAQDALASISSANIDFLGKVQDMQQFLDDYAAKHKELTDEQAKLNDELDAAREKWGTNSEQVQGATQALSDNRQAIQDLEVSYFEFMQKFASELVWEKLKSGPEGLTDAELEAGLQMDLTAGLIDQATVDMVKNMESNANAAVEAAHAVEQTKQAADDLDGTQANVTITTRHEDVYSGSGNTEPGQPIHAHAAGGSFVIPSSFGNEGYYLGMGHTASGGETVTITPKGRSSAGGGDTVVNIYYPKPEDSASEAVKRALKTISYLGQLPAAP